MLGLVRHARACPRFSKITKQQYLWEGLSYFLYLLHVVTHSWKLQCYHVVSVGYVASCPKFSEATNHQYLRKGSCDFVDFLQVICILLDIHWSYKKMVFRTFLAQLVSILRVKLWKVVTSEKMISFLFLGTSSQNISLAFVTFFSHLVIVQSTQFFSVLRNYKMFLMKHFSS